MRIDSMKFFFATFEVIIKRECNELAKEGNIPYLLDGFVQSAIDIFRYYFQMYENTFDKPHPLIKPMQIKKIVLDIWHGDFDDMDDYRAMIDKHFQTKYSNCDYNIIHFFSGDIRQMRYYETCYRGYE
jgi:hypothetical protein